MLILLSVTCSHAGTAKPNSSQKVADLICKQVSIVADRMKDLSDAYSDSKYVPGWYSPSKAVQASKRNPEPVRLRLGYHYRLDFQLVSAHFYPNVGRSQQLYPVYDIICGETQGCTGFLVNP